MWRARFRSMSRRRWLANADLKYIGKPTVRYDGAAKVTGAGKYTADIHLPGML